MVVGGSLGTRGWQVLAVFRRLGDGDELYSTQVADELEAEPADVMHALRRLETLGYLKHRKPTGRPANKLYWSLTEKGKDEGMRELDEFVQSLT